MKEIIGKKRKCRGQGRGEGGKMLKGKKKDVIEKRKKGGGNRNEKMKR